MIRYRVTAPACMCKTGQAPTAAGAGVGMVILNQGSLLPTDVAEDHIQHLLSLNMIETVEVDDPVDG